MSLSLVLRVGFLTVWGFLGGSVQRVQGVPLALNTNLQIRLVLNTTNSSGAHSVRIAKDPRSNQLYYLKLNGDIFRVDVLPDAGSSNVLVYSSADHGLNTQVEGFAIGPDGTMYVVGNITTNQGNSTIAQIMKGVPDTNGTRAWSLLAQTEPYPLGRTGYDHLFNGVVVSPDGNFIYVNSGARTDHGEVQSNGGLYPDLRDIALTAKIFRLPATASNLVLTNDLETLRSAGYVFAEGTRNAFALAFAPNGDLFATDNGPDRDMSDELNWLRAGLHYGFPWRMGGADNPQQFSNYDPSKDLLLNPAFVAVSHGFYHNDPTFPASPTNFVEPVLNLGPDADSYRSPVDGSLKIASQLGQTLSTFTAHRSPLGLVFDTAAAMAPPFQQHGFMLSYTPGDPNGASIPGPFLDPSQDLVDLDLTKLGNTNYQARVTRLVGGFSTPVDAAIVGNRVYVLEYSGDQGIWEITFPQAVPVILLSDPKWLEGMGLSFNIHGQAGQTYQILASTNLSDWSAIADLVATNSTTQFVDPAATNHLFQFYRVVLR